MAGANLAGECIFLELVSATTSTLNDSCSCCINNENSFDCSTFLVSKCSRTEHQNQQQVLYLCRSQLEQLAPLFHRIINKIVTREQKEKTSLIQEGWWDWTRKERANRNGESNAIESWRIIGQSHSTTTSTSTEPAKYQAAPRSPLQSIVIRDNKLTHSTWQVRGKLILELKSSQNGTW